MAYYILYFLILSVVVCGTGMSECQHIKPARRLEPSDLPIALYLTRFRWLHLVTVPDYIYQRLPSTFAGDVEAGLISSEFDISANIMEGDTRAGLDDRAKREVLRIMKRQRVDFDEARRLYMEQRFSKNNIGPDGRPRDPKFVSFS
ncbi:DUF2015 domain-containing protein [Aspergillus ibericus CBS 121593]|uniref:Uncharacterized protein n=1 Tax=Aspergillus ibericus CBS 121593 TaxID=1448316 RepID=A0A395GM60_9EURO|nr:hypothetical protein BO80DRAFT_225834 [Aspergillus ibericus CBS 121593]RAK96432.1 hypothetical protein BO80DRAFT_225834 [Aspergillus ibericus CBS 121593]